MKEANDPPDMDKAFISGWSLSDFLAENTYSYWWKTYGKVAQVSYGLINGIVAFNDLPPLNDLKTELRKISVINTNKMRGGKSSSSHKQLKARYQEFKEVLLEQLECLEPDIVIGGNVLASFYAKDLNLGEKVVNINGMLVYKKNKKLYLDAYHPAYWPKSRESYYNEIMRAVREYR